MARSGNRDGRSIFPDGAALDLVEDAVEHGENLEPPLDARIVASHFADTFDRLVIRKNAKRRSRKVASNKRNGKDNAASFEVEQVPAPLDIEAADVSDGPHLAVRLLQFERSANPVDACVLVHVKELEQSATARQPRNTTIRGVANSAIISAAMTSMVSGTQHGGFLFREGCDRADPLGKVMQEFFRRRD